MWRDSARKGGCIVDYILSCSDINDACTPFYRAENVSRREAETLCDAVQEWRYQRIDVSEASPVVFRVEPSVTDDPARFVAMAAEYEDNILEGWGSDDILDFHETAAKLLPHVLSMRQQIPERCYFLVDVGGGEELIHAEDDLSPGEVEVISSVLVERFHNLHGMFDCVCESQCQAPRLVGLRLDWKHLGELLEEGEEHPMPWAHGLVLDAIAELKGARKSQHDWPEAVEEWVALVNEDEKAEEAQLEELDDEQPPPKPQPQPRLQVDGDQEAATLDGKSYSVTGEAARFLDALVKADGVWVSSTQLLITKASRLVADLPEEIKEMIESATGKGYRIDRKKLWPN